MKKSDIIKIIISLPERLYKNEDISFYALLKESNYLELYNQISEADIFNELTQHLECINYWLSFSENKRSSSGWYFKEVNNNKYLVGYFPFKKNLKPVEYSDKTKACANFIKNELEDVRLHLSKKES